MEEEKKSSNYLMPISILIAGVLIAGSVIYSVGAGNEGQLANIGEQVPADEEPAGNLDALKPITGEDHILGDPNAPVKIVEFSDFDCPFCKKIHGTLDQLVKDYNGQVAWVYRHFPLEQLHPNAPTVALASECVASIGGNDAFWAFAEKWAAGEESDVAAVAKAINVDSAKFDACMKEKKFEKNVADDVADALATGGQGTPWNVVVGPDGKKVAVSGAQPISAFKQVIDEMLKK